jgi:hypothetical protein
MQDPSSAQALTGRDQLRSWVDEVEEPRRERDPQRLKAAYFEWASPEAARAQVETHARFHEDARASYEKQREDILARRVPLLLARLERTPASEQDAVVEFKAFAYSGLETLNPSAAVTAYPVVERHRYTVTLTRWMHGIEVPPFLAM